MTSGTKLRVRPAVGLQTLVFDLDSTLVNSPHDINIVLSFGYALGVRACAGGEGAIVSDVVDDTVDNSVDDTVDNPVSDILAGHAAGCKTYAVSWGTQDAETLQGSELTVVAPDLGVLLHLT